jgi:hypothetical protein
MFSGEIGRLQPQTSYAVAQTIGSWGWRADADRPYRMDRYGRTQSRSQKSGQDDRWNFCLTAGTLVPANQEIR